MEESEISEKVLAIIESYGPLPIVSLDEKLDYRYLQVGHIDSFAIESLIIQLEDTFDITLLPEDTQSDEFRTPGGIARLISARLLA